MDMDVIDPSISDVENLQLLWKYYICIRYVYIYINKYIFISQILGIYHLHWSWATRISIDFLPCSIYFHLEKKIPYFYPLKQMIRWKNQPAFERRPRLVSPRSDARSSQTPGSAMAQDAAQMAAKKVGAFSKSGNLTNRFTPVNFCRPHETSSIWCSVMVCVCSIGPRWSDQSGANIECAEAWIEIPLSSTLRPRGPLLEPEPTCGARLG